MPGLAIATVAAMAGTFDAVLSFDAPTVSNAFGNGPRSGGASVTVSGLSFAVLDYTATSDLPTLSCATSAWTSSTAVSCQPGEVVGTRDEVHITVSALVATAPASILLGFDPPVASAFSIQNAAYSGGVFFLPIWVPAYIRVLSQA